MFHVKHSLWHRWCSGRRRDRRPARLGDLASLGAAWCAVGPGCFVCPWAAARPRAVRAASLRLGASSRSPARPRHRPRAPQPGLDATHRYRDQATLAGLVVSYGKRRRSLPMAPRPVPPKMACPRAVASVERGLGERCHVLATVCKKSAAPAGLRTCVELRRDRNSLSDGRPSPGAWRRRAR